MRTGGARSAFFGWRIVAAAFVLAVFGWGLGFYGPPIYLHAVREARGWPLTLVSAAVTTHFLAGAITVANLPALYRRFGIAAVTKAAGLAAALGVLGWAMANAPWQLFAATLLSGAGWAATGGAAVNAIISPWFIRARPAALSMAYNGASIGGVVLTPLWVVAIAHWGFPAAAAVIGFAMALTLWTLADRYFTRTPAAMGLTPDGDAHGTQTVSIASPHAKPLPGSLLWRDRTFLTLAIGMALGLFSQIGMLAHLFSLLVPALGAEQAGLAMGAATAAAIFGRTLAGWTMRPSADRRLIACLNYTVQISGAIALMLAAGTQVPLMLLGILLFGVGIGNATSLPPLIAQSEFVRDDVARVVALIIAIAQGTMAFAPAAFGLIREFAPHAVDEAAGAAPYFFAAAATVQALAIAAFLIGRPR
jgi:MFS family permease